MSGAVQAQFFPLRGGLDLVSPPGQVNPGAAVEMLNYEVSVTGSYRRVDGYERFDGRDAPHLGNPVGYVERRDLIEDGMTEGESGEFPTFVVGERLVTPAKLRIPLGGIDLNLGQQFDYENQFAVFIHQNPVAHYLVGDYPDQAALLAALEALPGIDLAEVVGGVLEITTEIEPVDGGDPAIALLAADFVDHAAIADTEEGRREAILPLPGDGPVRGVVVFQGRVLAVRDNDGSQFVYLATDEGWSGLTLPAERLAGGKPQFAVGNFTGNPADEAIYMVDGLNPVLEIKGEQLVTTEIPDAKTEVGSLTLYPHLVEIHKGHLFTGYPAGSLQHSALGDPYAWDTTGGAGEIAMGQRLVAIKTMPGDALGIFTEESVRALYGTSAADWNIETVGNTVDGVRVIPGTIQSLGQPLFADQHGVRALSGVSAYGNFAMSTSTSQVKPLYDLMRPVIACSVIMREKNQYRLLASDGTCLILTSSGEQLLGIGVAKYDFAPICAAYGPGPEGEEMVVVGAADGRVYHLDVGTSFDGAPIPAALQLHFNHLGSPRNHKRFRKAVFDMDTPIAFDMMASLIVNWGGRDHSQHLDEVTNITGNHGLWNVDEWGEFQWGGQSMSEGEIDITASGRNLSILLYSEGAQIPSYELSGLTLHYSVRRLQR